MPVFSELFVLQAVGVLIDSKFSGTAVFGFENAEAEFRLHEGGVAHVRHAGLVGEAALAAAIWKTQGTLLLQPGPQPPGIEFDYAASVENLIATTAPAFPSACPMMDQLYLSRAHLKPAQHSRFLNTGFDILLRIKSGMRLPDAQGTMSIDEFWKGVLHLASNGQILCSYGPTLGGLARRLSKETEAQVGKLLGSHIAHTLREKIAARLQPDWPGWRMGEDFDPLYGSAPYHAWLRAVTEEIQHLGAPTLTQRCYKQALLALPIEQSILFHQIVKD